MALLMEVDHLMEAATTAAAVMEEEAAMEAATPAAAHHLVTKAGTESKESKYYNLNLLITFKKSCMNNHTNVSIKPYCILTYNFLDFIILLLNLLVQSNFNYILYFISYIFRFSLQNNQLIT